jgi:bifunctional non-homologous end joining protein LigD
MRAHLTCTAAGRSAEYVLELKRQGDAYVVAYQYGKIGSTLRSGLKTKLPVAWAVGAKAYNATLTEKISEGYVGEGQGAFAGDAPESVVSNGAGEDDGELLPDEDDMEDPDFYEPEVPDAAQLPTSFGACELLTPITEAEALRYINSDKYLAQVKEDGDRQGICKRNGAIFGVNRKGKPVALRPEVAAEYAKLNAKTFLLDGETVNGSVVWDVLQLDGADLRQRPYVERLDALRGLVGSGRGLVRVVRTWDGTAEKSKAVLDLHAAGAEGVVFKLKSAPWKPGRSGQHAKLKFWKSVTARVCATTARKHMDKNSVALELFDGGRWQLVGHVSVNGKDRPKVNDLVEVRYLNFQRALYQTELLRVRTDVDEGAASMAQLQHKKDRREVA